MREDWKAITKSWIVRVRSQFPFSCGCEQCESIMHLHILREIVFTSAVVLSIYHPIDAIPAKHKEADEAQAIVASLSKKLHGSLVSLEDNYDKTKENITKTVRDLAIINKVQDLLKQLNGHVPIPSSCEHGYIALDFLYKQSLLIETRSALPVHYTITLQGNSCI